MPTSNPPLRYVPTLSGLPTHSSSSGTLATDRGHTTVTRQAYKIHEAADALGVTPITIRRLIERGLIRPCRALRHVLIPVTELEKLLNT